MEEVIRGLFGDRITLTGLILILGFCGVTYSLLYKESDETPRSE